MSAIDARRALDLWVQIVRDEELYRAMLDGRHAELAEARQLDASDLAILDQFRARPGTRWNVENIRFRATLQVAGRLRSWMPLTTHRLAGTSEDWLNDLVFEYLTYHRWNDLGPLHLTECERFGQFVRERVMVRRSDPLIEHALAFELAVIGALKATGDVAPDQWPALGELDDAALAAARPRPGPTTRVLELPVDLSPWLRVEDPTGVAVREEPVHYLIYVPSLDQVHRVQTLGDGARLVFERCTGDLTTAELAAALEEEAEVDAADVTALVARWVRGGALWP
ncbi:MAG TPA: hypothetical protein VKZ63_01225 [Kofleriaceae bacterium]|nr:hypothetical protein [Kofleriaceae bacterium]